MTEPDLDAEEGVVHIRPFADILREIRRGDLHDELGSALQEVEDDTGRQAYRAAAPTPLQ